MNKKKFDGSISEIMVAYKPNGDLDFEPVKKMVEFQVCLLYTSDAADE